MSSSPGERRIAVISEAGLTEYRLWRPGAPDGVGAVHVGRVTAMVPAMAGSFVALADGEAFLPDSDSAGKPSVGELITVRVVRAAQGGKGRRVSGRVEPVPAPGTVREVAAGPTPLAELAAAYPDLPIEVEERALRAELAADFASRVREAAALDEGIAGEIEALGDVHMALPGGMRGTVVPTPALTAIDLDMGSATAARDSKGRAQLAANLAAIPEVARQIRLRGLSGAIVIDFAGLPARRRGVLTPALSAALAQDRTRPRLLGFTALGFAEILRPRVHAPLHELLAGPHAAGLAALRQAVTGHDPDSRLVLLAAPPVIAALQADAAALRELARHTRHCRLQPMPGWTGGRWSVEPDRAG